MKTLEGLAREMFAKFSLMETGRQGNWDYLSDERKLAWMQDVAEIADFIIKEVKSEFKPLPVSSKAGTVYESGYMEGVRSERVQCMNVIDAIEDDLVEQLESSRYNK